MRIGFRRAETTPERRFTTNMSGNIPPQKSVDTIRGLLYTLLLRDDTAPAELKKGNRHDYIRPHLY